MTNPTPPADPDDLLLFTPVVTAYRGANGWSSDVQRAFVAALARSGVVAAAARSVGRSASSAYQLRRRAGGDSGFARAWDEAQARAGERALDQAMAGGMRERRTPVWRHGRQVGWRTSVDNRLAYAALRALDRREARWLAAGVDARMLLDDATQLLNRRERCEASPAEPEQHRSSATCNPPPLGGGGTRSVTEGAGGDDRPMSRRAPPPSPSAPPPPSGGGSPGVEPAVRSPLGIGAVAGGDASPPQR